MYLQRLQQQHVDYGTDCWHPHIADDFYNVKQSDYLPKLYRKEIFQFFNIN